MEGAAFMYCCLIHARVFCAGAGRSRMWWKNGPAASWRMADAIRSLTIAAGERHSGDPMTLSLGFSPCPNDCFMFDAIVHERIDLEGLDFSVRMDDVEALNKAAR